MEMKNAIAREGREAKNLILYHLSSEDESNYRNKTFFFDSIFIKFLITYRNQRKEATNTRSINDSKQY